MTAAGKPVLPLDLDLGASQNDGDGAVTLNREMMSHPQPLFPKYTPKRDQQATNNLIEPRS